MLGVHGSWIVEVKADMESFRIAYRIVLFRLHQGQDEIIIVAQDCKSARAAFADFGFSYALSSYARAHAVDQRISLKQNRRRRGPQLGPDSARRALTACVSSRKDARGIVERR